MNKQTQAVQGQDQRKVSNCSIIRSRCYRLNFVMKEKEKDVTHSLNFNAHSQKEADNLAREYCAKKDIDSYSVEFVS